MTFILVLTSQYKCYLLLATAFGGWFVASFAYSVFDIFAARLTRRASTCLTHILTSSQKAYYHNIFLTGYTSFLVWTK